MKFGIVPLSLFELRSRWVSAVIATRDSEINIEREFDARERICRELKSPMVVGIVLLREFEERFRCTRFSRQMSEMSPLECLGRLPERLVCERVTKCGNFMPPKMIVGSLVVITTRETVRLVRFWRQLSQTPVSFLRLLTANSTSNLMEESGPLRKARVKRDLRVVMERATLSEQLASVRVALALKHTPWRAREAFGVAAYSGISPRAISRENTGREEVPHSLHKHRLSNSLQTSPYFAKVFSRERVMIGVEGFNLWKLNEVER
ncbi:hypothetical protein AAHA92_21858 [Salvia divinorum]|uniref:Maturase n=1 Tax=Salvia divinorum TaxID=28513 RepID=A0ABD1GN09_SALDI